MIKYQKFGNKHYHETRHYNLGKETLTNRHHYPKKGTNYIKHHYQWEKHFNNTQYYQLREEHNF